MLTTLLTSAYWPLIAAALLIAGFSAVTALLLQAAWNLTERAQRDDRHSRALLGALNQGEAWLAFLDETGHIVQANPAFMRLFNTTSESSDNARTLFARSSVDGYQPIAFEAAQQARMSTQQQITISGKTWQLIGQPWTTAQGTDGYWLLGIEQIAARPQAHSTLVATLPPISNSTAVQRNVLAADLGHAVYFSPQDFTNYYQPIYQVADHKMAGVALTVAWSHACAPTEFRELLALADVSATGTALWVKAFADGCQSLSEWQTVQSDLFLSLPVPSTILAQPQFGSILSAILELTGIAANTIKLELDGSLVSPDSQARILQLRAQGYQLSVAVTADDLSGLSLAERLQATDIQLGQTFIRRLHDTGAQRELTSLLAKLAAGSRRSITASGIVSAADLTLLQDCGCTLALGSFYGPTQDATDFTKFLQSPIAQLKTA